MKIVSITSSGRQNGNTERIVRLLEKQIARMAEQQHIAVDFEHIPLSRRNIQFCRGCRICFDRGEKGCPLTDDVLSIRDAIMNADGVLLASPIYVEDVNGIMKNWIDRMAFNCHRPEFFQKCAVLITTSGSGSSGRSLGTMKNALTAWGIDIVYAGKYRMGAWMENKQIESRFAAKTEKAAESLIRSIRNSEKQKPSFLSLISFTIQQKYSRESKNAGPADQAYWKSNGWLEPHAHYYRPINGSIRILAARILGRLVAKVFI